ncbi:MAG: alpha/beta hydrolase [Phycisphaerae bacterium]|nr:alpha/beta hydrolase [Phycisphaerae bacterium]
MLPNRARLVLVLIACMVHRTASGSWSSTAHGHLIVPARADEQRWTGDINVQPGVVLGFNITLRKDTDGSWAGIMDIPQQNAANLALRDVTIDGNRMVFTMAPPGAPEMAWARFDVTTDGDAAHGKMSQAGGVFVVSMKRLGAGERGAVKPVRPQTPKPPFPYTDRQVSYSNPADGTLLAATLTIPAGAGPHPAVVMITGSGAQDRDESLLGHQPFLIIADHLARNGIAVLRADDRGVGGSTGSVSDSTTEDFARDALAGVSFLGGQPEIDARRIGFVGHSEGGLVGPLAASMEPGKVAFVVMLAGPGVPGSAILPVQVELIARAEGASPESARAQAAATAEAVELVLSGASADQIKAKVRAMAESEIAEGLARGGAQADQARAAQSGLDQLVEAQSKEFTGKWFRYFLKYDPRLALRAIECPVLAVNGSSDLQVPSKQNLPEIEAALKSRPGGLTARDRVSELPNLNHLFQTCDSGSPSKYAVIEETFSPVALDFVTTWIRTTAGLEK